MNATITSILNQYGPSILLEERRFASILSDLSPNANEVERKVIQRLAQTHIFKDLYYCVFSKDANSEAGTSKVIVRMKEEGFTKEWCQIAIAAFGLNTDAIDLVYTTSSMQQYPGAAESATQKAIPLSSMQQSPRTELDIYLTMAIDGIDGKDYVSAQKVLYKALFEAPRDGRILFLSTVAYEGDKRTLYAKRLAEAFPESTEYERLIVEQSINKEQYLYAFYTVKDRGRMQMCLENGASPNMLYSELTHIVDDAGIFTADRVNYDSHNGFGTIFFCSVYEQDYALAELCLKAGATMYPEKNFRLNTQNPDNCANPSRCAVMSRLMRSNDIRMLRLICEYIPEIVNVEFASRTMNIAYQNEGRLEADNEFGHADIYAGAAQSPLSYCVEYDIGNFHERPVPTFSMMNRNDMVPFDNVMKSGASHRYLETAKWLIASGANVHRLCDSLMFASGRPKPKYNVSLLSMAVDRGNMEMVQAIIASGAITQKNLDVAITWSTHNEITDYLIQQGASSSKASTPDSVKTVNQPVQSGNGGCYIATAVYGSYDCPEVWTLRRFRDQYLQTRILGRLFVRVYYAISPRIVQRFKNNRVFNSFNRRILNVWVRHLRKEGYEETPYQDPQ